MQSTTSQGRPLFDEDTIRGLLSIRSSKRKAQYETINVISNIDFPKLEEIDEPAIIGTYSMTLLKTKKRFIVWPSCLKITRQGEDVDTATCLSRDYLKETYFAPRVKHEQVELISGQFMPIFVKPTVFDYGYYIDVKSAWWSIMNLCGWNVDYWPGKWLLNGRPPRDYPYPLSKLGRSALVSVAQSYMIEIYDPKTKQKIKKISFNSHLNYHIYATIAHVLSGIGIMAASLGCVYVNADGMIAPNEDIAVETMKMIDEWKLPYTTKGAGRGWVKAIGCYRVGDLATRRNDIIPHPLSKFTIEPEYLRWFFPKWKKMSDRVIWQNEK